MLSNYTGRLTIYPSIFNIHVISTVGAYNARNYDGNAVIISWVTADETGSSKVQYGTSEKKYEFTAEGKMTNYTFYKYNSGYIHHVLVDGLEVIIIFGK